MAHAEEVGFDTIIERGRRAAALLAGRVLACLDEIG